MDQIRNIEYQEEAKNLLTNHELYILSPKDQWPKKDNGMPWPSSSLTLAHFKKVAMNVTDRAAFLAFIGPLSLEGLEEYDMETQLSKMFYEIYETKSLMKFTPTGK